MPEADSWQWHIVLYTSYKLLSLHLSVEYIVRFPSPVGLIAWAPNRTLPNYPLNHSFDAFLVRAIELSNPISYAERSHDTHSATTWSINCAFRANATCIRALQIATEVVQSSTAYRDDAVYTTDSRSDLQWPCTVVHYVSVTWLKVSATRAQSLLAGSPYSEQWYCLITGLLLCLPLGRFPSLCPCKRMSGYLSGFMRYTWPKYISLRVCIHPPSLHTGKAFGICALRFLSFPVTPYSAQVKQASQTLSTLCL